MRFPVVYSFFLTNRNTSAYLTTRICHRDRKQYVIKVIHSSREVFSPINSLGLSSVMTSKSPGLSVATESIEYRPAVVS